MTIPKFDANARDFLYWWEKQGSWFEDPNNRRGGFSGVLTTTNEQGELLFIKRQEAHIFRSLRYPFTAPTIVREYNAYIALNKINIKTPELVYCGKKAKKATLVTKALVGFISLEQWLSAREQENYTQEQCLLVMSEIAKTFASMHKNRLQHNCIYTKHIFLKLKNDINTFQVEIALLDLEKTRKRLLAKKAALHDMLHVKKHIKQLLSEIEWEHLITSYESFFGKNFSMLH